MHTGGEIWVAKGLHGWFLQLRGKINVFCNATKVTTQAESVRRRKQKSHDMVLWRVQTAQNTAASHLKPEKLGLLSAPASLCKSVDEIPRNVFKLL